MGNCQAIDAATLVIQHPCGKVDKFYWPVSASEIMRMNPGHYVALLISTTLYPTPTLTNNTNKEEFPNNNNSSSSNNNNSSSSNNNNNSNSNSNSNNNNINKGNSVRLTRIKLLRPTDTLVLGQVYRLITTQEVMKGLSAKKHAKMNGNRPQSAEKPERANEKPRRSELDKDNQVMKHERHRPRTTTSSTNSFAARSRMWQPSLQSISEAGS